MVLLGFHSTGNKSTRLTGAPEEGTISGSRRRRKEGMRVSNRRRRIFIVITAAMVWGVCELIVALALPTWHSPVSTMDPRAFIEKHRSRIEYLIGDNTGFIAFDPTLGWSHKPWGHGDIYQANGQGLRADRDYSQTPPPGILRIATFGDSFMLGADVEVDQTWQAVLEGSDSGLEVLNFGVSSYGTGQAVLRYQKEGKAFTPDIAVLSFIAENSRRNINTFRPFYLPATGFPLAKPRFRLEGSDLILVDNPVQRLEQYQELLDHPETELPRIGRFDAFYQQYNPSTTHRIDNFPSVRASGFWLRRLKGWWIDHVGGKTEILDWYSKGPDRNPLLFRIFDLFHDEAVAGEAEPVFLLFPIHFDYLNAGPDGKMTYQFLVPFLEAKGYSYIDCAVVFQTYLEDGHSWADLFAFGNEGGHYSPLGHRLIASAFQDLLKDRMTEVQKTLPLPSP